MSFIRILKQERLSVERLRPSIIRRALAIPVKTPPQPASGQKPDAATPTSKSPNAPTPSNQKVQPQQQPPTSQSTPKPAVRVPPTVQKPVQAGQKPQPASVQSSAVSGVKAQAPQSGQRVQAVGAPSAAATAASGLKPTTVGLVATGAVAGLVGIYYWQRSEKNAEDLTSNSQLEPEKPGIQSAEAIERADVSSSLAAESVDRELETEGNKGEVHSNDLIPEESANPKEVQQEEESEKRVEQQKSVDDVAVHENEGAVQAESAPSQESGAIGSEDASLDMGHELHPPQEDLVFKDDQPDERPDVSESHLLQKGHELNVKRFEDSQQPAYENEITSEKVYSEIVKDLVAAIHSAEQRQAESDAAAFREQLQLVQEKHIRDLKEAEMRIASYAELVHQVEKDLDREKQSHADDVRRQKEEAEQLLRLELENQEAAAKQQMEEIRILSKAEALNEFAEDRVTMVKDIGSLKLHMEALNSALDKKSEEVRQSHILKKLSLGTFALEDAVNNGASVSKEIALLVESSGGDALVDAAVSSLPKQAVEEGTLTPLELDNKFLESQKALKQLSMIPSAGGGVLSYLLATIATMLKMKEWGLHEEDDDGVDGVLGKAQRYLRDGKLVEAADVLEKGMAGSKAEGLASEWATQARNRAIMEQACTILRCHAATIALSLTS